MADGYEKYEQDTSPRSSRGGKGGRGKKRGGAGGKIDGPGREILISKALSRLLRHDAVEAGLKLDDEGYARVDQVVSVVPLFFTTSCQMLQHKKEVGS